MIGVAERGRGRGLGKALALHRYHTLREEGFELAESETTLRHERSLLMHFSCGFRPKRRLDPWNTPDAIGGIDRFLVDRRLARLYGRYARRRTSERSPR
jgi:GNAT superfamily N-acetyltransferase